MILLALVVERARRFIEDEDARVGGESARDGDALALAAGEIGAPLLDHGVIALRQLGDEFMRARQLRHADHLAARHRRIGERDVVMDGAVEQKVFLEHHADLAAQPGGIGLRDVDAVDQDLAALRLIKTLDELRQSRLAGARRADDANHLAGLDRERDFRENLGHAGLVAEIDGTAARSSL